MRSKLFMAVLVGFVLILYTAPLSAAGPTEAACALLTQARVSMVLGVPVDAGEPIAGRASSCQWTAKGKFTTLTITQPLGGKTPIERFNEGKKTLPGITVEPVSGVGDDAYYVYFANTKGPTTPMGLVVKKGSSSFEIRVYGFPSDQAKTIAKTLTQDVATKL
jgi:hypothetical protein